MYKTIYTALAALSLASAQNVGTNTAETHPPLNVQSCTKSGGCTTQSRSIVLDANWRWLHSNTGYTNCYTGQTWDSTLCPDAKTCASNCAVDGADYSGTYGIKASGSSVDLGFVTQGSSGANIGSRVYLMQDASNYQMFNLLNGEFTFDVDVSQLPCGLNGALYFSQMDQDGGMKRFPTNKAGAKYGTGYCDAQCPRDMKFIEGVANVAGWTGSSTDANSGKGNLGTCCSEMDIWEANSFATAYTPHPCTVNSAASCTGDSCTSTCDAAGCDFNSWRMGNHTFYGPGLTVDTKSKITVVTQFITDDNTNSGNLVKINRFYVQNGKLIPNSQSDISAAPGNAITDSFCAAQKSAFSDGNDFAAKGGLKKMGAAFKAGMVLVMSIWDDHAANCLWLDSSYPLTADASAPGVNRGPCATTSGDPKDVEKNSPNSKVSFSNIKWGDLNSTYTYTSVIGGGSPPPPTSSSTTKVGGGTTTLPPVSSTKITTTTTAKTTTSAAPTNCAPKYGQCGGQTFNGPKCCQSGSTCTKSNDYYSQCL